MIPPAPEGRLSLDKLIKYAMDVNAELARMGASRFCEVGHEYGYYVINELSPVQYASRVDRSAPRDTGVHRSYDRGLTAKGCLSAVQRFYYEAIDRPAPEVAS